jgi:hypothetical protein
MTAPNLPTAVEVHQPQPITAHPPAASIVAVQSSSVPTVASVVLPDGRVVTGYAIEPAKSEPVTHKPPVSRMAVNAALGGVGFLAVCGGLLLLTSFIAALTTFVTQLITFAAVVFGGWIAVQIFGHRPTSGGTTVNIRKAVIKRNKFQG